MLHSRFLQLPLQLPLWRSRPTPQAHHALRMVLSADGPGATIRAEAGLAGGGVASGIRVMALAGVVGLGLGCGGLTDLGGKPGLPAGVSDPATVRTPAGALGMYRAAVADFQLTAAGYVAVTGLLTDELQDRQYGGSSISTGFFSQGNGYTLDVRVLLEGTSTLMADDIYGWLHGVRRDALQAISALATYDSAKHPALMAEAYALEGYAEVLLADLYCSGIPLSTIQFEGDVVFRPGSSTQEVYHRAVALFDSALALAGDSAQVLNLARVGKGRVLLDLGDYAGAAASVAAVPDAFRYQVPAFWNADPSLENDANAWLTQRTSVSDGEGGTGRLYRSGGDPRTQVVANGTNNFGQPVYFPAKYGAPGSTTSLVIASGIEARLIQAEAALQVNATDGQWLTILNVLRTTCSNAASCPTPAPAGTGGVAGLPPLGDPGTAAAQLDTLFAERAAWLFVTGTRQGDLRRLVRSVSRGGYGRPQQQVYPSGVYPGLGGVYGSDVTAPIPPEERYNPLFTGCFDRGA